MSFLAILGIVFVTLKLAGFIAWSWWLVLLPFILQILAWFFLGFIIAWVTDNGMKSGQVWGK